jgi:hypothetical protein
VAVFNPGRSPVLIYTRRRESRSEAHTYQILLWGLLPSRNTGEPLPKRFGFLLLHYGVCLCGQDLDGESRRRRGRRGGRRQPSLLTEKLEVSNGKRIVNAPPLTGEYDAR